MFRYVRAQGKRLWPALVLLVWAHSGTAEEQSGKVIFQAIDQRHNSNYVDLEVELGMLLTSRKGRVTERKLRIRQLEENSDGDRVIVVFDEPGNIRGTGLLTYTHLDDVDDQWLFLPALNRVKKIASRNKSGAFVGSEFSYEDLTAPEVEKFHYRHLGDEACPEIVPVIQCALVERVAKDEFSGYSKELHWISPDHYLTRRVEYYDKRKGNLIKILRLSDYRSYPIAGEDNPQRLWKPHRMVMENVRTANRTELVWGTFKFAQGFTLERHFSLSSLRRVR